MDLWVEEKTVVSVTDSVNEQRIILLEVMLRIMVFNFYQWIDFCLRNVCGKDVIHKDPSDSDYGRSDDLNTPEMDCLYTSTFWTAMYFSFKLQIVCVVKKMKQERIRT